MPLCPLLTEWEILRASPHRSLSEAAHLKGGNVPHLAPATAQPELLPDGKELLWGDDKGVEIASVANPGSCATVIRHFRSGNSIYSVSVSADDDLELVIIFEC